MNNRSGHTHGTLGTITRWRPRLIGYLHFFSRHQSHPGEKQERQRETLGHINIIDHRFGRFYPAADLVSAIIFFRKLIVVACTNSESNTTPKAIDYIVYQ
ncbi:MAG: hypothetical protein ACC650_03420 [Gammaproteobacteria bacterium]